MGGSTIELRLLGPGDEDVVRALASSEGPGDPERPLADPRTLLLAAFDRARGIREGFVLTEPDNEPANRLYRSVGGSSRPDVLWELRYTDD